MNMQASFIQILLVFLVTFVAAIDQFSFFRITIPTYRNGSSDRSYFGRRTNRVSCWGTLPINDNR